MKTARGSAGTTGKETPAQSNGGEAQPLLGQRGQEIQPFGAFVRMPLGLAEATCQKSATLLNQILADSISLRDLYKKHHWQVAGLTFYQLHLLFDKHAHEQSELIDALAERIQTLGGISVAMAHDVAELTRVSRPPRGREEPPAQISRLLEAHELLLKEAREAAHAINDAGDDGSNDLLVSEVIRTNELQAWFLAQHLVDTPPVRAE